MPELEAPVGRGADGGRRERAGRGVAGALFVLPCLLAGCAERLSATECDALLDHYTARLALEENAELPSQRVAQKQLEARELARAVPAFEFDQCADKVSRTQWDCALAAGSVDAIERCLM